jgi:hypothetical protein
VPPIKTLKCVNLQGKQGTRNLQDSLVVSTDEAVKKGDDASIDLTKWAGGDAGVESSVCRKWPGQ